MKYKAHKRGAVLRASLLDDCIDKTVCRGTNHECTHCKFFYGRTDADPCKSCVDPKNEFCFFQPAPMEQIIDPSDLKVFDL